MRLKRKLLQLEDLLTLKTNLSQLQLTNITITWEPWIKQINPVSVIVKERVNVVLRGYFSSSYFNLVFITQQSFR